MKSLFSRFRHKDTGRDVPAASTSAGPSRRGSTETINNHNNKDGLRIRRQSVNHDDSSHLPSPTLRSTSSSRPGSPTRSSLRPPFSHRSSSSTYDSTHLTVALGPPRGDDLLDHDVRKRTSSVPHLEASGVGEGGKKVTFRSPVPTPPSSASMGDTSRELGVDLPRSSTPDDRPPQVIADRSRPHTLRKHSLPPLTSIRPRHPSSTSTFSSSPITSHTPQPSSVTSPVPSTSASLASETSLAASTQSYLAQPNSWSEMAEEELIANLGPKERTRQEVLWEIVSSEERYVQELVKLNDTFCRALLPPSAQSPTLTLDDPLIALSRTLSPSSIGPSSSPAPDDSPNLPIAARYARSASSRYSHKSPDGSAQSDSTIPSGASARLDAYNKLTNGRPTGPARTDPSVSSMRDKARAHQSLPPPSRGFPESRSGSSGSGNGKWSGSFARLSHPNNRSGGSSSRIGSGSSLASITRGQLVREAVLPDELEKVLAALSGGILEGHLKLAAALRKRYEDQYPLVRSLADVFTAHSYILREYATYILHLEASLGIIDSALSLATQPPPRRHSRQLEADTGEYALGIALLAVEELATERGESGLAISLSKPFQRLLKYPLLFQNLLFNTDPSLREYEATLAMVDEVEMIVRRIEDEKISKDESERTRDGWARIEGLESEKELMAPKSDRLLIEEVQLSSADCVDADTGAKSRKAKHRLSDMLKKTEKAELWIIRFTDVSLLCEKTGTTQLPVSSTKSKRESVPEGGRRSAPSGRRTQSIRARNLYRFVKVHEWHPMPKTECTEVPLPVDQISAARTTSATTSTSNRRISSLSSPQATPVTPRKTPGPTPGHTRDSSVINSHLAPSRVPLKTEDGPSPARTIRPIRHGDTDTIVSDRQSVMSFAFNGGDLVRPTRPRSKAADVAISTTSTDSRHVSADTVRHVSHSNRTSGGHLQGKAADAKFAHRLRATEAGSVFGDSTLRPNSSARRSLPPAMMRSAQNIAGSEDLGRPITLNPQALDRAHLPAPLSPRNGMNGLNSRSSGKKAGMGPGGGMEKEMEKEKEKEKALDRRDWTELGPSVVGRHSLGGR